MLFAEFLTSQLTVTTGFSAEAWPILFPDQPKPIELKPFTKRKKGERFMPNTGGSIFIMIKSTRMDLNFQVAKYLKAP